MSSPRKIYDAAIVGGGPAASALAILMAREGSSVLVLERSDFTNARIGESLDPSIRPLLQRLGLWESFLQDGHTPAYAVQSAWGSGELRANSYLWNPHGHAWHVDRKRFDLMLNQAASEAGATCLRKARLVDCRRIGPLNWALGYRCRDEFHRAGTKLLVDATGRTSSLSRQIGIDKMVHDRLIGVAAKYRFPSHDRPQSMPTVIESVVDGWWYAAPLPDHTVIIVYMTDVDIAVKQHAHTLPIWHRRLEKTTYIAPLVATGLVIGKPRVFPAYSQRVSDLNSDDVMPVGDAFMALDPLSGQGVVHALQNAIESADLLNVYLGGNTGVLKAHVEKLDEFFNSYQKDRQHYYRMECRWKDSIFWKRRHALN